MGELEKAYGAALSKTKRGAFKQAAVAGVIGLGGVYIAKEKYKKRKEAAERMLNFQTSINPLLVQRKELYRNGTKWWKDFDSLVSTHNQEPENYAQALKADTEQELLTILNVEKSALKPLDFQKMVDSRFQQKLKLFEQEKKLYSELKPYATMEKSVGQKKYLAPIMADIEKVEKNISKSSNLGKAMLRKLFGEAEPTAMDLEVVGGRGKTHFLSVDSSISKTVAAQRLVDLINSNQNKLGLADEIEKSYVLQPQLLDDRYINQLLGGVTGVDGLIKTNVDTSTMVKEFNDLHTEAFNGLDTRGNEINKFKNYLNSTGPDEDPYRGGMFRFKKIEDPKGLTTNMTYHAILQDISTNFDDNKEFRDSLNFKFKTSQELIEAIKNSTTGLAVRMKMSMESPYSREGQAQEDLLFRFDNNRYYGAAFQTVVDEFFTEVTSEKMEGLKSGREVLSQLSSYQVTPMAEIMIQKGLNTLGVREEGNTGEASQAAVNTPLTFNVGNNSQRSLSPADFALDIIETHKNNSSPSVTSFKAFVYTAKQNNATLFKNNPEAEEVIDNYLSNYYNKIRSPLNKTQMRAVNKAYLNI